MTPGDPELPIYRGAQWAFAFLFVVVATEDPLDLTGLGPFVCEIKDPRADRLLATATITSDYDATGTMTIVLTPDQTRALPVGPVRIGLRDAQGNPYLEWFPEVKWFTPNPP
jgi:hypothetical protein